MAKGRKYYGKKPLEKRIKKVVKSELKKELELKKVSSGAVPTEMFLGNSSAGGGQTVFQVSAVAQGDADNERIGDKIKIHGMNWKYWVQNGLGASAVSNALIRVMMFQYKGPDTAETAATFFAKLFISDTSAGGGNNRGPLCNRNTDYMELFNIIYDKIHTTSGTQTASVPVPSNYAHVVTKYIKFKKCKKIINFINGGTSNGTNNIYIAIWSFNASVTDNPTYAHEYQLHYTDA